MKTLKNYPKGEKSTINYNFERLNDDELGKVRGGTSDPPIIKP